MTSGSTPLEIRVPDIGDFEDVEVVEILVAPGDRVDVEDSLVSIESDKATMEIPSPAAGTVVELAVKLGDAVAEGSLLLTLEAEASADIDASPEADASPESDASPEADASPESDASPEADASPVSDASPAEPAETNTATPDAARVPGDPPVSRPPVERSLHDPARLPHASPLVRKAARELGVDLNQAAGSGPQGRILEDDVKGFVRDALSGANAAIRPGSLPAVDFAAFGDVETLPLTRIQKVSARRLGASWPQIPQVTQHDEADITGLEAFRKKHAPAVKERGVKLTFLPFLVKAVVAVLQRYELLRSSLDASGENVVIKHYFHIGIAVDTESGLVVPVVRDADQKGIVEIAAESAELAGRARNKKLSPADLQGACFTISSLGGIGGGHFTPIVNAPEVAILGVGRATVRPVWREAGDGDTGDQGEFVPRSILPISLSYDHRVIDGALAARFTTDLSSALANLTTLLL